jgi:hypothetical protein
MSLDLQTSTNQSMLHLKYNNIMLLHSIHAVVLMLHIELQAQTTARQAHKSNGEYEASVAVVHPCSGPSSPLMCCSILLPPNEGKLYKVQ